MSNTKHPLVVIPGDGIGPEVTDAALRVLEAAGAPIEPEEHHAGQTAIDECGEVLPDSTLDAIRKHGLALKGPCSTPVGKGFRSVNVQLRQKLELYAAIRPVRSLDGVKTRYEGVDLVVFRENTEGLYAGVENVILPGVVTTTKVVTEKASMRIARAAFAYAKARGREKVTVFHKANIMKITDGLFLERVEKVHTEEFPEVPYDTMIIDAGCMRLVQDPTRFDVLLMENFYGDVVSDLCAGLVGGLGVTPGANIGEQAAIFEAVHGSAPDIAGQNKANPLALIMSGVMLLNHLHETRDDASAKAAGDKIKTAYNAALAEGDKTADLGGSLSTSAFADALIKRIK
ncbi:MAG: isocitrate/isopropylmalate dehydrogenase family protein [Phycisphaeraceae bacterium]